MEANEVLPDHMRCHRTDGKQWRCRRPVKENKKLCEVHYIQGIHRQHKEKVPASLKLIRKPRNSSNRDHASQLRENKIRAGKIGKILKAVNAVKKSRTVDASDALDDALRKMKLKMGNLQLELIRVFLKRQVQKREDKELERNNKGELMRELPNGKMAISPSASTEFLGNVGPVAVDIKLGIHSTLFPRRCFRSKNIDPLPIAPMQIVPYARNSLKLKRSKRKKCHWCRMSSYRTLVKCSKCRKEFFCTDCIEERYCDKQELIMACVVCRKTCSCRTCSRKQCKDVELVDPRKNKKTIDKIHLLHYLIFKLLPTLQHINQEQDVEIEIEAHIKGKSPSEIQVQRVELCYNKFHCCNCNFSILSFHRRCTNCSYNLCLNCCWEFCRRKMPGKLEAIISKYPKRRKAYLSGSNLPSKRKKSTYKRTDGRKASPTFLNWKSCNDGSISCPPVALGGCGIGLLDLRCVFPFTWTKELEASAEEIVCGYKFPDVNTSENKAGQNKFLQEVATREDSSDNFLYYPTIQELRYEEYLQHFQGHWGKGHPVIVQNVLTASDLSWDPVAMFCTYLEKSSTRSQCDKEALKSTNCLDWCEVEIGSKQIFIGSLESGKHASVRREMLKFRSWLSSHLFQDQFPAHYAEIIRSLPLQEYMNPVSGLLNLAIKAPQETTKPFMGPCMYISYGGPEDLVQAEFLAKLCYDSNDVVNILAHATDVPISTKQISKIKQLMKGYKAQDHRESTKSTTDKKSDETKENSSSHSESIEGLDLQAKTVEELQLTKGVSEVFSDAPNKDCASMVKDKSMPHATEEHLEFDSDVSIFGFRSIPSSEETDSQDDLRNSSCFRKKLLSESFGAQWDIFRREDVPKLMEYLKRHSKEFSDSYLLEKHVIHPILDQSFFLDTAHMMRLKQEFNIEPWTFKQHTGEAVIIPAGCPYQIRKFKSCVNIVLDFVSPENAAECINLIDDLRLLPMNHKAKEKRLKVKEMTLYSVNDSIKEIHNLMQTTRTDME